MATSKPPLTPGTVVRVPFPYTDAETRQFRPALILANFEDGVRQPLLWVLMVTSRENFGEEGDVEIPDAAEAGLPAPSIVRTARIATVDFARIEPRGQVRAATMSAVRAEVMKRLVQEEEIGEQASDDAGSRKKRRNRGTWARQRRTMRR